MMGVDMRLQATIVELRLDGAISSCSLRKPKPNPKNIEPTEHSCCTPLLILV